MPPGSTYPTAQIGEVCQVSNSLASFAYAYYTRGSDSPLFSDDLHAFIHGPPLLQPLACVSLQHLVPEFPRSRDYTPVGTERPPTSKSAVASIVFSLADEFCLFVPDCPIFSQFNNSLEVQPVSIRK
jgi:hypothetical protein